MRIETYFVKDGRCSIHKTPTARLLYGEDLVDWLAQTGTTLTAVTGTVVGVTMDGLAFIQGTVVCAWITGLDEADGAENSLTLRFTCADGSVDERKLYFLKRP